MRPILSLLFLVISTSLFAYEPQYCSPNCESNAGCYDWSGLYVGGYVGGAWGGRVRTTEIVPFNPGTESFSNDLGSTWIGGGTLGYNFQSCCWLFGIENEAGFIQLRGRTSDPNSVNGSTVARAEVGCFYDVLAARVGYACNCVLFYGKFGLGVARLKGQVDDTFLPPFPVHASEHKYSKSWAAGLGLEWGFCKKWSTKAEYVYINVQDKVRSRFSTPGLTPGGWDHHFHGVHTMKFGINYRFALCGCGN